MTAANDNLLPELPAALLELVERYAQELFDLCHYGKEAVAKRTAAITGDVKAELRRRIDGGPDPLRFEHLALLVLMGIQKRQGQLLLEERDRLLAEMREAGLTVDSSGEKGRDEE